jgi:AcrR family transcriptional regulator
MAEVLSRKQEIRQVAGRMFRERGYSATSMRELAKAVGIEAPSLYNHFASKEALLNDICFGMAEAFFVAFKSATEEEQDASAALQAAMQAHLNTIASHLELSEVFFREWPRLSEPELSRFRQLRSRYEAGFRKLLREGMQSGQFQKLNDKVAVFTMLSALNAAGDILRSRSSPDADELSRQMSRLLLKGIIKK